jgi:hypothetical protein
MKLNPIIFSRDGSDRREIGFSAQDVFPILPEVVAAPSGSDEMLGLQYDAFIPVLVNAVKELAARVVALEGGSGPATPLPA